MNKFKYIALTLIFVLCAVFIPISTTIYAKANVVNEIEYIQGSYTIRPNIALESNPPVELEAFMREYQAIGSADYIYNFTNSFISINGDLFILSSMKINYYHSTTDPLTDYIWLGLYYKDQNQNEVQFFGYNQSLNPRVDIYNDCALSFNSNTQVDFVFTLVLNWVFLKQSNVPFSNVNGYDIGYNEGYNAGLEQSNQHIYNEGYNAGIEAGNDIAYQQGYNAGLNDGRVEDFSFFSLIMAVMSAPATFVKSWLNFDLFGLNVFKVIAFAITLTIVIAICKLISNTKGDE